MSARASGYIKALVMCPNGELITAREKLVAMVLADSHQDKAKHFTYPSVETIATESICDKRTCQRYLDSLERKGVLLRRRPANQGRAYMIFYFFPALDVIPEGWQDATLSCGPAFAKRVAEGWQKGGERVAGESAALLERAREQELQPEQKQRQHPPTPSTSEGASGSRKVDHTGNAETGPAELAPDHGLRLVERRPDAELVTESDPRLGNVWERASPAIRDAARAVWRTILEDLQKQVNRQSFETWLKHTAGAAIEGHTLFVNIPSEEFQHIGDKYSDLIRESIDVHGFKISDLLFVTSGSVPIAPGNATADVALEQLKTELCTVPAARSWVMRQCGFVDRNRKGGLGPVIEASLRQECEAGKTLLQTAPVMVAAWKSYVENGEYLRIKYGPVKFFELGIWKDSRGWAWDEERLERRNNARTGSC